MKKIKQSTLIIEKVERFLIHRRLPLFAMLLGILVGIPTLWTKWGPSDDVIQRSIILNSPLSTVLTRLFVFLDPAINSLRMDAGSYPWWTYEPARIIFFRPIAAFSLWLDYQIWPDVRFLMHLHSLILYGVLCLLTAQLFRRFLGNTPQAGLATILFSLSTAHIGCVVSLAARNLILTTIFGLLVLVFHDRWQREQWKLGFLLSIICLLLSLLSAETGVATLTYLLAYVLFISQLPWRKRIISLLPYAVVTFAWLAAYHFSGFGAFGSGFYLSPLQDPIRFTIAVIERVPFILIGQWILPDPVVYTVVSDGARVVLWILSVGLLVFVGFLLAPLVKRNRAARLWFLGMLLAVIPVCAVSPASGRHLTFISLGAFGLMGQFITGVVKRSRWTRKGIHWRRAAMGMCLSFLFLHGFIYPVAGSAVRPILGSFAEETIKIDTGREIENTDVILVNPPSPSLFIYLPSYWEFTGKKPPAHLRILAPGFSTITLASVNEYTLLVQPESGFLESPVSLSLDGKAFLPFFHPAYSFEYGDGLFRGSSYPLKLGERVLLDGATIEVVSLTKDGRPLAIQATFSKPLTDRSFTWLQWDWESSNYFTIQPPHPGSILIVPGPY